MFISFYYDAGAWGLGIEQYPYTSIWIIAGLEIYTTIIQSNYLLL
jgi:hypothetical protein